jgi:aryl-alcohol dehydrogenase
LRAAKRLFAVGGNAKSLALALGTGATHTVNRRECGDIPATIKQITKGGLNYAIDTTGVPDFVKTALLSLKNGGTAAVVGAADGLLHISQGLLGGGKSLTGVTEGDSIAKLFIPQLLEYHKAAGSRSTGSSPINESSPTSIRQSGIPTMVRSSRPC